jgi:antitoxin VapB
MKPRPPQTAKIFQNGRSQAVRLPAAYRFDTKEVFIRQDPATGDVILSARPNTWDGYFEALQGLEVPEDFLSPAERQIATDTTTEPRDPFDGWTE